MKLMEDVRRITKQNEELKEKIGKLGKEKVVEELPQRQKTDRVQNE